MPTPQTTVSISNYSAQKLDTIRALLNLESSSLGHVLNISIDLAYRQILAKVKQGSTITDSV